jgi:hypothetical protein
METDNMEYGYIYKITCVPTNKVYIGQVKEHKYKNGKAYKYGIEGRWSDHVSKSRDAITEFYSDIRKYGVSQFIREELVKAPLDKLDALEAEYILKENSVIPQGYNRAKHSQVKNRENSNITEFFKPYAIKAEFRPIRRNGSYHLVYVVIHMSNNEKRRIVFGQNRNETYQQARESAVKFIQELGCPYEEDLTFSEDITEKFTKKVNQFIGQNIQEIRITTASSLIAVYVRTETMKSHKDVKRLCFGGKNVPHEQSYYLALSFVEQLPKNKDTVISDTFSTLNQSSQQAGTTVDEANSTVE